MTTANYPFAQFLEIGQEVRRTLQPQTELIANIGDFKQPEAYRLPCLSLSRRRRGLSITACEQMLWEAGFKHERKLALVAS